MKWRTDRYGTPREGATRLKRKFAWLPKRCDGGYTVWLETYESQQVYKLVSRYSHLGKFPIQYYDWVETNACYLEVYI